MRIAGLDLASKFSAVSAITMVDTYSRYGVIDVLPYKLGANWVNHECRWYECPNNHTSSHIWLSNKIVSDIVDMIGQYNFVVIEDYTRQSHSYDSYNVAELSGMIRYQLHQKKIPVMFVAPMRLKAFLNVEGKTPITKKDIAEVVEKVFVFKSEVKKQKEREDEVDSFVLAQMGLVRQFLLKDFVGTRSQLSKKQIEVFTNIINDEKAWLL